MKNITFSFLICILVLSSCKNVKKEFYNDGNLKYNVEIQNDEWNGIYKEFYKNGNLKEVSNFEHNLKEGISLKYFDNGNTKYLHDKGMQGMDH